MAVNLADLNFYRAVNPDLAGFNDPEAFSHLINNGVNEGRVFSPYIDLNLYRAANPDLAAAGLTSNRQLYDHLQNAGVAEGRTFSPVFDANFYRAANPDLAAAGLNNEQLLDHFRGFGINEGRASAPNFQVSFYLAANPDLAAAGFNFQQALQHYVLAGIREGRTAAPTGPAAPPPLPPPPPPPVAEPGTTPETSANLGILTGVRTFDNFVGNSDLNDYYRFTLDQVNDFNLVLGGMTDNADVNLYLGEQQLDGSVSVGQRIASSQLSGTTEDSISRSLGAGTYFVQVYPFDGFRGIADTKYTLRLTTGGGTTPQNSRTMELSEPTISPVDNDPIINPRSFTTANDSAIQTFTANGNAGSDLTGGLGNATANLLLNESFTGRNDFANLLAANPVETPDFSQGLALI